MSPSPAYLAGRVTGFLVRPLLPLAESALAGVLDGLFGEPDALDATYTPTPDPGPRSIYTEPGYGPEYDGTWTLDEDRIAQIRGDAA